MAAGERDDTSEWVLPPEARPATLAQLEQRIEYAVAVARASEAAALEIGAAAIDAAEQARQAAELAARASRGMVDGEVGADADAKPEPVPEPESAYDSFKHFLERADRISARLEAIAPERASH
jgi:Iap family predicted aminopeptidase